MKYHKHKLRKAIAKQHRRMGLSISYMSRGTGISRAHLSRFFAGKGSLRAETLEKVLWMLDLTVIPIEHVADEDKPQAEE